MTYLATIENHIKTLVPSSFTSEANAAVLRESHTVLKGPTSRAIRKMKKGNLTAWCIYYLHEMDELQNHE